MAENKKIIVICGSSRFIQEMAVCAWLLERDEGAIVLSLHLLPWWYPDCPSDHLAEHEGVANKMDALHIDKLNMAKSMQIRYAYDAEVFVVDVEGYTGLSTQAEVHHATEHLNLPIRWYSQDPVGRRVNEMAKNRAIAIRKALEQQGG